MAAPKKSLLKRCTLSKKRTFAACIVYLESAFPEYSNSNSSIYNRTIRTPLARTSKLGFLRAKFAAISVVQRDEYAPSYVPLCLGKRPARNTKLETKILFIIVPEAIVVPFCSFCVFCFSQWRLPICTTVKLPLKKQEKINQHISQEVSVAWGKKKNVGCHIGSLDISLRLSKVYGENNNNNKETERWQRPKEMLENIKTGGGSKTTVEYLGRAFNKQGGSLFS